MKPSLLIAVAITGSILVGGLVGYRSIKNHYSCVGCRNFQTVTIVSLCGVELSRSEAGQTLFVPPPGRHSHDWSLHSRNIRTVISTTFECATTPYADGKDVSNPMLSGVERK